MTQEKLEMLQELFVNVTGITVQVRKGGVEAEAELDFDSIVFISNLIFGAELEDQP